MYIKQSSKLFIVALIALMLSCQSLLVFGQATEAKGNSISFVEQGNLWVKELSLQPQFSHWVDAKTSISPLGPGTHSWLMLVEHETKGTVGYLIIHSDGKGGYILGEYGTGDSDSLSNITTYRTSLHYYDPLHNVVTVKHNNNVDYLEPFIGEHYELTPKNIKQVRDETKKQKRHGIQPAHALITNSYIAAYHSPYSTMPWLTTTSLNEKLIDDTSIKNIIELGSELKYTSSIWNDTVEAIYSVTGFHEWELFDDYIALQQENEKLVRYIPYNYLLEKGNFYEAAKTACL